MQKLAVLGREPGKRMHYGVMTGRDIGVLTTVVTIEKNVTKQKVREDGIHYCHDVQVT
jgi:hypothetical protein